MKISHGVYSLATVPVMCALGAKATGDSSGVIFSSLAAIALVSFGAVYSCLGYDNEEVQENAVSDPNKEQSAPSMAI